MHVAKTGTSTGARLAKKDTSFVETVFTVESFSYPRKLDARFARNRSGDLSALPKVNLDLLSRAEPSDQLEQQPRAEE